MPETIDRLARMNRDDWLEMLQERAAIMEFDGGLCRVDAKAGAMTALCRRIEEQYGITTTPGEIAQALRRTA